MIILQDYDKTINKDDTLIECKYRTISEILLNDCSELFSQLILTGSI